MGASERAAQSQSEKLVVDRWLQHYNETQKYHFVLDQRKPDAQAQNQNLAAPDFIAHEGSIQISIEVKALYRDRQAGERNAVWIQWFGEIAKALTPHVPEGVRYWLRSGEVLNFAGLASRTSPTVIATQIAQLLPDVPADDQIHRYQLDGLPFWIELRRRHRPGPPKIMLGRVLERPIETPALTAYLKTTLANANAKFSNSPWATTESFLLLDNREYTLIDRFMVQNVLLDLFPSGQFSRINHAYFVDRIDEEEADIFEFDTVDGNR